MEKNKYKINKIAQKKFKDLRSSLKNEVLKYLPFQDKFLNLFFLDKSTNAFLKKDKIFNVLTKNIHLILSNIHFHKTSYEELKTILNLENDLRIDEIYFLLYLKYKNETNLILKGGFPDTDYESFCKVLYNLKNLKSLKLKHFFITFPPVTNEVKINFSKCIENLPNLEELELLRNNLYDGFMFHLCEAISKTKKIYKLSLKSCFIENIGLNILSSAIEKMTNIRILELEGNNFNNKGIETLMNVLKDLKNLKFLNLSYFSCDLESIKLVSDYLKITNSLEILYFSDNDLKNQGLELFADALKENKSLKEIWLENNRINDIDLKIFTDILYDNEKLEIINLNKNSITEIGLGLFDKALLTNKSIKYIYLKMNIISIELDLYFSECNYGRILVD